MNFKHSTDDNALGLIHLVEPVLLLLDEMYSGIYFKSKLTYNICYVI